MLLDLNVKRNLNFNIIINYFVLKTNKFFKSFCVILTLFTALQIVKGNMYSIKVMSTLVQRRRNCKQSHVHTILRPINLFIAITCTHIVHESCLKSKIKRCKILTVPDQQMVAAMVDIFQLAFLNRLFCGSRQHRKCREN